MTLTIIEVNETTSITKLTAADGMVLTNDEAYGKEIFLGKYDSPENWHEITDAEYEEIQARLNPDPGADMATMQEKAAAYDILMGVTE